MSKFSHPFIEQQALAAYLGFAIGDALGVTVEFMSPKKIQARYGVHSEIIGGGWMALPAGQVSDDTQMCLALAQAVLDKQDWNIFAIADGFVRWMQSNPPDIGNITLRGLKRYQQSGQPFGDLRSDDAGNGACMRNLPVVLLSLGNDNQFVDWSLQQSHITHHHPLSDAATLALGRMTRALIMGEDIKHCQTLAEQLSNDTPAFNYQPYAGKASAYIVDTVQTVLHYFFSTDSFESCLVATVNQGGDADTTGALVGMLAGAKYGLAQIPTRWLNSLDKTVYQQITEQTSALLALGKKLTNK